MEIKNIIIAKEKPIKPFTLKDLLNQIKEIGINEDTYHGGYDKMVDKINEYLVMIE